MSWRWGLLMECSASPEVIGSSLCRTSGALGILGREPGLFGILVVGVMGWWGGVLPSYKVQKERRYSRQCDTTNREEPILPQTSYLERNEHKPLWRKLSCSAQPSS